MSKDFAADRIARLGRLAAGLLVLLLASAPAAAEQARAVLSVSAVVTPACAVDRGRAARSSVAVACSSGASVSTMTATRHDEQPLDEAAEILGAPMRRDGGVVFTAPVRAAAQTNAAKAADGGTRYLTVTY